MMKIKSLTLKISLTLTGLFILLGMAAPAGAFDPFSQVCNGTGAGSKSATCTDSSNPDNKTTNPAYHVIHTAANIIAVIGGIAAVVVIMISGLNYITSGGDAEKVKGAKTKIIGAVAGLVILALAYTITAFALNLLQ